MTGLHPRKVSSIIHIGDLAAPTRNGCVIGPFGSDLKTSDFTDFGVPVVFVQNVRPGIFNGSRKRFVSVEKAETLAYHQVVPGDLVITKMGLPPCVAAIYPDTEPPGIVTADIIKLSVDPAKADPRYVMHYLNSPYAKREIARITFGVTRPKVTLADFRRIGIQLPSIEEQRRIAAILDKADAIRRKREEGIRLTEELLRSTFLDMFGDPATNPKRWERCSVGEVAEVQGGLQIAPIRDRHPYKIPYLRVANVYRDRLDLREIKKIGCTVAEFERVRLLPGDILLVEGHGNREEIGRSAIWDGSIESCVHQNHLIRLRVNRQFVESAYMNAFINSEGGRRQLVGFGKTTSGLNTISVSNVRQVRALLPPISKQRVFATRTEKIRRLLANRIRAQEIADRLLNSVVQRAFRGEL